MKRFHVHVSVPSVDEGVAFYSRLFAAEPSVVRHDYAKWMLEDPRVNFAISARGRDAGVNHLGFQVATDDDLQSMRDAAREADIEALAEDGAQCCYASSNKHWIVDPAGVPWETFHTLGDIPVFGEDSVLEQPKADAERCCAPVAEVSSCCG